MFGPLAVDLPGATLGPRDFDGVKPKQLLELLLLQRGRTAAKEQLADALWGDRLPARVAPAIETYVSLVRRRLGDGPGRDRRIVLTVPGGYQLSAAAVDVDVDRFDELTRAAAAAEPARRRDLLDRAVRIGADDLLADEPYADWVALDREHYRARRVQALVDLAECCLRLDDPDGARDGAERAIALERTCERAYRAVMRAHHRRGDRGRAVRAYAACRAALSAELGVEPAAETVALHNRIRGGVPPAGPELVRQPVAYATVRGARIAYQVVGAGPVDLVFVPSFVTNLGATWDDPTYAAFLRRLAGMSRLILFDKRGTGLSDPAMDFPTTRERSDDLVGVLDAAGSRRAVLFGVCGGGALCAQLAADHPGRVAGLVLHNSFARMIRTPDYPWGWSPEAYARLLDAFEEAWLGDGSGTVRRNPSLATNPRYRDWFARYLRLAANPWLSRRLAQMNAEIDVRPLLPSIRTPCLVTCTTEDVWLSPDNSRYLAGAIPGARLLELPGVDHDPWAGEPGPVLGAVARFLATLPR